MDRLFSQLYWMESTKLQAEASRHSSRVWWEKDRDYCCSVCWSLYVPYVHLLTLNSSILQTFREVDAGFILNFMFQSSVNVVLKLERWFDPSAALWAQWSVHAAFFKILVTTCTIKFEQVRILRVCDLGRTHLVSCKNELVKEIWLSTLVGDILYWMGLIHC